MITRSGCARSSLSQICFYFEHVGQLEVEPASHRIVGGLGRAALVLRAARIISPVVFHRVPPRGRYHALVTIRRTVQEPPLIQRSAASVDKRAT